MLLLCAAYVFGCAFRSVLPRADVQRICLFDTWLSSVVVGRSVATDCGDLLHHPMGDRSARARRHGEVGHRAQHFQRDRSAHCARRVLFLVRGAHHELSRQRSREFALGRQLPAGDGRSCAAARGVQWTGSWRDRGRNPWERGLPGFPRLHRRADVSRPLGARRCDRKDAPGRAGRPARRQHAVDRDPGHRALARRDGVDGALFQRRGVVEPGVVRLRTDQAPPARAIAPVPSASVPSQRHAVRA